MSSRIPLNLGGDVIYVKKKLSFFQVMVMVKATDLGKRILHSQVSLIPVD